jgi:D-sedoheptulose 7-phosphate isomerase
LEEVVFHSSFIIHHSSFIISMINRIASIVSDSLEVKRRYFAEHREQVAEAAAMIADSFHAGGKVLLCGNGGSAADAQHIAGEFVNRFLDGARRALPALALSTDGGVLTCIANDTGFERVFARQIEALGARGDLLIAISTSGNSPNIIAAAEEARTQEMKIIGLLGRDAAPCQSIRTMCDRSIWIR